MEPEQKPLGEGEQLYYIIELGSHKWKNEIQKAILEFGQSKAGKSTSGLHMSGEDLLGVYAPSSTKYMLKDGKLKNGEENSDIIGAKEHESQTQIPNRFIVNGAQDIKTIIDCPGFHDSKGCFRIIGNAYFVDRVFSLVKEAKFLIVCKWSALEGLSLEMLATFTQFLDMLTTEIDDYKDYVSLLLTNVPQGISVDKAREFYSKTPEIPHELYKEKYKSLKESIVEKKRVHIFHQAKEGEEAKGGLELFEKINEKCRELWRNEAKGKEEKKKGEKKSEKKNQKQEDNKENLEKEIPKFNINFENYVDDKQKTDLFMGELTKFKTFFESNTKKLFTSMAQIDAFKEMERYLKQLEERWKVLEKELPKLYNELTEEKKKLFSQNLSKSEKEKDKKNQKEQKKDHKKEMTDSERNEKEALLYFEKIKSAWKLYEIKITHNEDNETMNEVKMKNFKKSFDEIADVYLKLSDSSDLIDAKSKETVKKYVYEVKKQIEISVDLFALFLRSKVQSLMKGNKNLEYNDSFNFIFTEFPKDFRRFLIHEGAFNTKKFSEQMNNFLSNANDNANDNKNNNTNSNANKLPTKSNNEKENGDFYEKKLFQFYFIERLKGLMIEDFNSEEKLEGIKIFTEKLREEIKKNFKSLNVKEQILVLERVDILDGILEDIEIRKMKLRVQIYNNLNDMKNRLREINDFRNSFHTRITNHEWPYDEILRLMRSNNFDRDEIMDKSNQRSKRRNELTLKYIDIIDTMASCYKDKKGPMLAIFLYNSIFDFYNIKVRCEQLIEEKSKLRTNEATNELIGLLMEYAQVCERFDLIDKGKEMAQRAMSLALKSKIEIAESRRVVRELLNGEIKDNKFGTNKQYREWVREMSFEQIVIKEKEIKRLIDEIGSNNEPSLSPRESSDPTNTLLSFHSSNSATSDQ